MNRKIFFPIAIIIVIVLALLVGGIVVWQYYGMPKEEEETPEELPTDETADWKTYRSEYYGIEIKYPKEWSVIESEVYDNYIVLMNNNDSSQQIMILKSSGPPPETMDMEILEIEDVMVGGVTTKRELFRGRFENNRDKYYLRVFIPEKNLFYHADFNESNFKEFSSIYDKILSTFKFID